jgi:hypothetical protein
MFYIQLRGSHGLETVDEFETRKEARAMLREYQMLSGGQYYMSSRACKEWRASESKPPAYDVDTVVDALREILPHGSGIDCEWTFNVLLNGKIRASNSYHCMTEHGFYNGYADFTLTFSVYKSLRAFSLSFNGKTAQYLNKKYILRDYLEETVYEFLPADKSVYQLGL